MGICDINENKSKKQLEYIPLNENNSLAMPISHEIFLILKINEKDTIKKQISYGNFMIILIQKQLKYTLIMKKLNLKNILNLREKDYMK